MVKNGCSDYESDSEIPESNAYGDYAETFNVNRTVNQYHSSYAPLSISDLFKVGRILGWLIAKAEISAVTSLLKNCKCRTLLDIPCGAGKLHHTLENSGFSIIGADRSLQMLRESRKSGATEVALICSDIRAIPLRDEAIDVVICLRFLHRIPFHLHRDTIEEISRVASSHTIIYFARRRFLSSIIARIERATGLGDRGMIHHLSKADILCEINRNGWSFVKGRNVLPLLSVGYVVLTEKVK